MVTWVEGGLRDFQGGGGRSKNQGCDFGLKREVEKRRGVLHADREESEEIDQKWSKSGHF